AAWVPDRRSDCRLWTVDRPRSGRSGGVCRCEPVSGTGRSAGGRIRVTRLSYAAALESAMAEEMRRDPHVYTMATSPSPALLLEHGPMRVKRMPISEATMTGIAVGSAGCGYRPVVHWGSVTFAFMAFDQVVNQACKIRYMFGAQRDFPIVFRARYGNG